MDRVSILERQVQELRQELYTRPIGRQISRPLSPPAITTLVVGRGQTLYTGATTIYGISWLSGNLTTPLPAAAPTPGSTYTAGLGYGYIVNADGTVSASPVWVAHAYTIDGSLSGDGMSFAVTETSRVFSISTLQKTYTGGGVATTPLYVVWRA